MHIIAENGLRNFQSLLNTITYQFQKIENRHQSVDHICMLSYIYQLQLVLSNTNKNIELQIMSIRQIDCGTDELIWLKRLFQIPWTLSPFFTELDSIEFSLRL